MLLVQGPGTHSAGERACHRRVSSTTPPVIVREQLSCARGGGPEGKEGLKCPLVQIHMFVSPRPLNSSHTETRLSTPQHTLRSRPDDNELRTWNVVFNGGDINELLVNGTVTRGKMQHLAPGKLLNDDIINEMVAVFQVGERAVLTSHSATKGVRLEQVH